MNELRLSEREHGQPETFHDYVASQLGFPAYYGRNLDALNDCLGDVCEPLSIVIECSGNSDPHAWFARAVRAIRQAAADNDLITVEVRTPTAEAPASPTAEAPESPVATKPSPASPAAAKPSSAPSAAVDGSPPASGKRKGRFPRHLLHGALVVGEGE